MRPLRDYQLEGIEAIKQTIRQGVKRMVVSLPVGGGKTLISAAIAQGALSKGNRLAFCCPRIALVDQTLEEYAKEEIYDVGVVQARHHLTDWSKPIQICSIDSVRSKGVFPDASIVIFDEIHLWRQTYADWMAARPDTIFIALSATPGTKGLAKHFDTLITIATMKELMDKGWLSKYKAFGISDPDLSGVRKVAGDYDEGQLADRLIENKQLTADIVETWKQRHGQDRTLCFAVNRDHAKVLQARFIESGINAGYQDALTPRDERAALKKSFHDGSMPVLVSVETLIIGVDYDVRAVSWCRPTQSRMLFVQAFGRGVRLAPPGTDPKEHLVFLDHAGTITKLGYPEDIIFDELDSGEKKPKEKENTSEVSLPKACPQCAMLIPKGCKICPNCGYERKPFSAIREEEGELVELTRGLLPKRKKGEKREYTMPEKAQFFAELKGYAAEKGYKDGWAANKHKEKFGTFPNHPSIKYAAPCSPSIVTRSWIKAMQIKWVKSKKYAEQQAGAK
jgi:superfamily II DNA or RNA helicase